MHWINTGQWPVYVGFTMNEQSFKELMTKLKVSDTRFMASETSLASTHLFTNGDGPPIIVITTKPRKRFGSMVSYASFIAHEAMHAIDRIREVVNQGCPLGDETEAYLMQHIVRECLNAATGFKLRRTDDPTA